MNLLFVSRRKITFKLEKKAFLENDFKQNIVHSPPILHSSEMFSSGIDMQIIRVYIWFPFYTKDSDYTN